MNTAYPCCKHCQAAWQAFNGTSCPVRDLHDSPCDVPDCQEWING